MLLRVLRTGLLLSLCIAASLSCGDDDAPVSSTSEGTPTRYADVPSSKTVEISGLKAPVDVVRDKNGMVHIAAHDIEDAMRVQGYQVARDRTIQLEFIRRSATGRLAELSGDNSKGLIDQDITMRTVGLARVATQMVDLLTPEEKRELEAFADGVSQFNARALVGEEELAGGMIGLSQTAFQPWTVADVIAVARFQAMNLAYSADDEINQTDFVTAAREKLVASSQDPALAKRAGLLVDLVRFAPSELVKPLDGFPNDTSLTMSFPKAPATPTKATAPTSHATQPRARAPLAAAKTFVDSLRGVRSIMGDRREGFVGSNNWIVAPSKSATGHAMLASDPHLSLQAPSVFWMVQVSVGSDGDATPEAERVDFAGLAFPGLPGIILGFNKNVAWGATTADYDVTDVYEETISPDGSGVMYKGQVVPFQKVHETIKIANTPPVEYDVLIVPHHGPIIPTITADHTVQPPAPGSKALSVKWTGHSPTKDISAPLGLVKAKNVDDARIALRNFAIGAENWVVADTSGNIFYTTQANIPKRDKSAFTWDPATFTGNIPCFVLPGDGTAEWTGAMLEEAFVPHQKNPPKGWLATANTEQVGTTFDNDPTNDKLPNGEPMYMGAWHSNGHRLARIQKRIEEIPKLTPDDMSSIQGDARSAMGSKLAPAIVTAIDHALEEVATPGSHKDLSALVAQSNFKSANFAEIKDLLARWGSESDYLAASGMNPDDNSPSTDAKESMASRATMVFNAWHVRMFHLVLDDELKALGFTYWPFGDTRPLLDLMLPPPSSLKTFDATMNDSILFDDLTTTNVVETRDERTLTALLDAIDFLKTRLGQDSSQWQWGRLHTIRFVALVSLWKTLSIPADPDPVFPLGFPRHGDGDNVDVAGYGMPAALDATTSFSYSHGPTQRFVIDMDPAGVVARNALPGGNVWDSRDPHFRDEAELWRKNQTHPVAFRASDVIAAAEGRTVYKTSAAAP